MTGAEDSILAGSDKFSFLIIMVLAFVGFTSLLIWAAGWRSRRPRTVHEQYDIAGKSAGLPQDRD